MLSKIITLNSDSRVSPGLTSMWSGGNSTCMLKFI